MQDQVLLTPLNAEVEQVDKELRYLHAEVSASKSEQRVAKEKHIKTLQEQFRVIQAEVERLNSLSKMPGDDAQKAIHSAWKDLKQRVEQARGQLS